MYSYVIEKITLCYLVNMETKKMIDMHFIDIVTIYINGKLNNDIYIRVTKGLKIPKMGEHQTHNIYLI